MRNVQTQAIYNWLSYEYDVAPAHPFGVPGVIRSACSRVACLKGATAKVQAISASRWAIVGLFLIDGYLKPPTGQNEGKSSICPINGNHKHL